MKERETRAKTRVIAEGAVAVALSIVLKDVLLSVWAHLYGFGRIYN